MRTNVQEFSQITPQSAAFPRDIMGPQRHIYFQLHCRACGRRQSFLAFSRFHKVSINLSEGHVTDVPRTTSPPEGASEQKRPCLALAFPWRRLTQKDVYKKICFFVRRSAGRSLQCKRKDVKLQLFQNLLWETCDLTIKSKVSVFIHLYLLPCQ